MSQSPVPDWVCLVISLPGRRGATRMRIWRALRAAGAAVLRDGVYLMPGTTDAQTVLQAQAQAVRDAGGSADVLVLTATGPEQDRGFRARFDRGPEYARMLEEIQKLKGRRPTAVSIRRVQVLRREYSNLSEIDFFPGPATEQVNEALSDLETTHAMRSERGEPLARAGTLVRRDPKAYQGRTWATRARPWVDRLASAWLIRRFIDPKARILWLRDIKRCPKRALGFDFNGAAFSHVGARVTFEHMLASFGLEHDAALARLGRLVHCLDVGGAPVPEAQGLAAVLAGAREQLTDDNRLLTEACRIFDHLYHSYQRDS